VIFVCFLAGRSSIAPKTASIRALSGISFVKNEIAAIVLPLRRRLTSKPGHAQKGTFCEVSQNRGVKESFAAYLRVLLGRFQVKFSLRPKPFSKNVACYRATVTWSFVIQA
jgi:hypothetical protein